MGNNSECSSGGSESGWTLYLLDNASSSTSSSQQSLLPIPPDIDHEHKTPQNIDEQEEDLSMLSDASSAPPHSHPSNYYYSAPSSNPTKLLFTKRQKCVPQNQLHHLDDTASSPIFHNNTITNQQTTISTLDYSQGGFSATYFEKKSSLQDHFDFSQNETHIQQKIVIRRERDENDIKNMQLSSTLMEVELVAE